MFTLYFFKNCPQFATHIPSLAMGLELSPVSNLTEFPQVEGSRRSKGREAEDGTEKVRLPGKWEGEKGNIKRGRAMGAFRGGKEEIMGEGKMRYPPHFYT